MPSDPRLAALLAETEPEFNALRTAESNGQPSTLWRQAVVKAFLCALGRGETPEDVRWIDAETYRAISSKIRERASVKAYHNMTECVLDAVSVAAPLLRAADQREIARQYSVGDIETYAGENARLTAENEALRNEGYARSVQKGVNDYDTLAARVRELEGAVQRIAKGQMVIAEAQSLLDELNAKYPEATHE